MNNEELKTLAEQLRQPDGLKGLEIADNMNETNIKMTFHSIDHLDISNNDHILELGHGNCKHLSYVLKQKNELTYYGLEISELMNNEAKRVNQRFIEGKQALFYMYDGQNIPFEDNHFDKIFTVNTIYFWTDPKLLLAELFRVLKPNGILNITFAQQDFMEQLPFTQFSFTLYDNKKINQLIDTTPFQTVGSDTQTETIKSKTGDIVNRDFTTIILTKCPNCTIE